MKQHITSRLVVILIFSLAFLGLSSHVSAGKKIRLNHSKYQLKPGQSVKLKIKDSKNTKSNVKWKSSRPNVASVTQKGVVKAKKAGKTTITATRQKQTASCKVTVQTPANPPNPTATPLPTPPNVPREEGAGWLTGKVIAISNTCMFEGYTGYIHISYDGSDTIASDLIINDAVVYTKNNVVCSLSDLQPGDWINCNWTVATGMWPVNTVYGVTQVRILGQ